MLYYFKKRKVTSLVSLFFIFSFPLHAQWVLQGAEIDGVTNFEESGQSASLSSDGKTVAIGA